MRVPFSDLPGRHERHLRRRLDCRLFPRPLAELADDVLLEAQRQDHEELIAFVGDLRNADQLAKLCVDARLVLLTHDRDRQLAAAWERLAQMEAQLRTLLVGTAEH